MAVATVERLEVFAVPCHGVSNFIQTRRGRRSRYLGTVVYRLLRPGEKPPSRDSFNLDNIREHMIAEARAQEWMDVETDDDFVQHLVCWFEPPFVVPSETLRRCRGTGWYDIHASIPICRYCFEHRATRAARCGHMVLCPLCPERELHCDDCTTGKK